MMTEPLVFGKAKLLPHPKGGWVLPGGGVVVTMIEAKRYATIISDLIERGERRSGGRK